MPYRPCSELRCVEIYSLTVGESVINLNDEAIRNLGMITLLVCAHTLPELVKELTRVYHQQTDYYNSLLYGITRNSIEKPQRFQNAAARVVYRAPKFCHITLLLFELHSGFWLGLELYSRPLLLLSRLSIIWHRNTSQI